MRHSPQAGIRARLNQLKTLDSRFHGDDEIGFFYLFTVHQYQYRDELILLIDIFT